jgi:hypothetical protein
MSANGVGGPIFKFWPSTHSATLMVSHSRRMLDILFGESQLLGSVYEGGWSGNSANLEAPWKTTCFNEVHVEQRERRRGAPPYRSVLARETGKISDFCCSVSVAMPSLHI